jgi:hypothetical protein
MKFQSDRIFNFIQQDLDLNLYSKSIKALITQIIKYVT